MTTCYVIDTETICETCLKEFQKRDLRVPPRDKWVPLTKKIVLDSVTVEDVDERHVAAVQVRFLIPPGCVYCGAEDEGVINDLERDLAEAEKEARR